MNRRKFIKRTLTVSAAVVVAPVVAVSTAKKVSIYNKSDFIMNGLYMDTRNGKTYLATEMGMISIEAYPTGGRCDDLSRLVPVGSAFAETI